MNYRLHCALALSVFLIAKPLHADPAVKQEEIRAELVAHATPLRGTGEARLLTEARSHDFFLLGEIHGEHEIPELIKDLWPQLWKEGYRHVGAELSPWAAQRLQYAQGADINSNVSLWTEEQAQVVHQFAKPD